MERKCGRWKRIGPFDAGASPDRASIRRIHRVYSCFAGLASVRFLYPQASLQSGLDFAGVLKHAEEQHIGNRLDAVMHAMAARLSDVEEALPARFTAFAPQDLLSLLAMIDHRTCDGRKGCIADLCDT